MQTMYPGQSNSPTTVTTNNINNTDTSIYVLNGSSLPDAPNYLVLGDNSDSETVLMTAKDGDLITVERGVDDTITRSWASGTAIARNFTNADYMALKENVEELDTTTGEINNKVTEVSEEVEGARGEYDDLNGRLTANDDEVRDIKNGTTVVGNANKLDGLEASDFAPDGFGVGGECFHLNDGQDLNAVTTGGSYEGTNLVNVPGREGLSISSLDYLFVIKRSDTWALQILANANGRTLHQRALYSSGWLGWEQIYPAITSASTRSVIATQKLMLNSINYEEADATMLENTKEIANDLLLNGNITEDEINEVIKEDVINEVTFLKIPEWQLNMQYNAQDIIRYKGEKYICAKSHESQIDWAPDIATTMWDVVNDNIEGAEWKIGVNYEIGQIVTYNDVKYECVIAHKSQVDWTPDAPNNLWEIKGGD